MALATDVQRLNFTLELYHNAFVSPYLTAQLEIFDNVKVIGNTASIASSCIEAALSITRLRRILLVDPSVVLIFRDHNEDRPEATLWPTEGDESNDEERIIVSSSGIFHEILQRVKISSLPISARTYDHGQVATEEPLMSKISSGGKISMKGARSLRDGKGWYTTVGTVHFTKPGFDLSSYIAAWIYPKEKSRYWMNHYVELPFFFEGQSSRKGPKLVNLCEYELSQQLKSHWYRYLGAYRFLLVDRPVGWVAFDGGLVPQLSSGYVAATGKRSKTCCSSFNSLSGMELSLGASSDRPYSSHVQYRPCRYCRSCTDWYAQRKLHSVHTISRRIALLMDRVRPKWSGQMQNHNGTIRVFLRRLCELGSMTMNIAIIVAMEYTTGCTQTMNRIEDFISFLIENVEVSIVFDLKAPTSQGASGAGLAHCKPGGHYGEKTPNRVGTSHCR